MNEGKTIPWIAENMYNLQSEESKWRIKKLKQYRNKNRKPNNNKSKIDSKIKRKETISEYMKRIQIIGD